MENVGYEYFQELLSRSFFQISSGNKSRFVMHDLLSHFAVEVSGRYCCRLEDLGPSVSEMTRYLSLLSVKYSFPVILRAINTAKLLRTFLLLDHGSYHLDSKELLSSLSKLQFLRVLSLSHYPITELPDSISNFKYLQYIDLSHTAIQMLPESVCDLYSLQTLILSFCHSLTELPENIWKLLNLRHLIIRGTDLNEMPKKMSSLKYLQTLSYFVVAQKSGSTVEELGGLQYLHGTLSILKLQNVVSAEDAAGALLVEKTDLDELVLEWVDDSIVPKNVRDVLEQLEPHTNLKKLSIKIYCGTRFPHWLGKSSFSSMVSLRLSDCMNCVDLPPLWQLPSLKVLIIESMDAVTGWVLNSVEWISHFSLWRLQHLRRCQSGKNGFHLKLEVENSLTGESFVYGDVPS